jgi:predicted P-loop ATPase
MTRPSNAVDPRVVAPEFWRNGLITTEKGAPKRGLANVMHVLTMHPEWADVLAYDAFGLAVVTRKRPPMREQDAPQDYATGDWTDEDSARTAAWFAAKVGFEPGPKSVDEAVAAVARRRVVHPVRDWLASLTWDGNPRLSNLASGYLGAAPTAYGAAVGRRWLIAAVARVFEPGCKVDSLLGLEGEQGIGKSSALRLLAGADWFADTGITIGEKDSYQALRRKWIYEFAELASIRGREVERVKNFLSSQVDTFRASYGRRTQDHPRQVVFAGSTNESQYLADPTGSRRFWPLRCGIIDLRALERDRNQLWAEARVAYQAGEPWHLDTPELRALAAAEQAEREERDDWDDIVDRWLRRPMVDISGGVTTGDVLLGALGFAAERITPAATKRVGHVMARLSLQRRQVRVGGNRREWRYFASGDTTGDDAPAENGSSHHVTSVTDDPTYARDVLQDGARDARQQDNPVVTTVTGDHRGRGHQ